MKRKLIYFLSFLFPAVFVRLAYDRLVHPRKYNFRDEDQDLLSKADQAAMDHDATKIRTYSWGSGERSVLLVHGWEGGAANFAYMIPRLVESGFSVHAFDGPSHGRSEDSANPLFDFPLVVIELIKAINPDFVISHSFGSVSATYALAELPENHLDGCVLITSPDKFVDRVEELSQNLGAAPVVYKRLIKRIERQLEIDASSLNVSDFVPKICTKKALILHDINDRVIPAKHSANVHKHWPGSQLELLEGTGHFRILKSDVAMGMILEFLAEQKG